MKGLVSTTVFVRGHCVHVSGRWHNGSMNDWHMWLGDRDPVSVENIIAPEVETDIVRAAEEKIRKEATMTLNDYQQEAHSTSNVQGDRIAHSLFGHLAEAGEIAAVLQKFHRGDYDWNEVRRLIRKELGDSLWYLAEIATVFGWTLDDVARTNLDKLAKRQAEGKIGGSGDER